MTLDYKSVTVIADATAAATPEAHAGMYAILVTSNICQTTKEEIRSERIWLSNSPSSISWFSLPPDTYLL